uniref:Uncharacterized protein n=1 Tax=Solanum tuberosum TaxID=4113 RepID=M1D8G7_SOLTU
MLLKLRMKGLGVKRQGTTPQGPTKGSLRRTLKPNPKTTQKGYLQIGPTGRRFIHTSWVSFVAQAPPQQAADHEPCPTRMGCGPTYGPWVMVVDHACNFVQGQPKIRVFSVLSPEGKDQISGEMEQSACRRAVPRSSTILPNDQRREDAEGKS